MGFLDSCWSTILLFSSFSPLRDYDRNQQLLSPPHSNPHDASHDGLSPQKTFATTFQPPNSSITCQYPTGYQYCGTASNRTCWLKKTGNIAGASGYDINTDYEKVWPTGVVREYWLNIAETPIGPDGYLKPVGLVINNTYPGPVLEACWGDTFKIHVTNRISTEGSTIHWHGIRQFNTTQMDGTNGVTQCPIAQNDTFTYQFLAQQYGHTWYHSHYQTQYSDGVQGGLVIHGPSSANYDEAWNPVLMTDWVHDNSSNVLIQELDGAPPVANSLIMNGTGSFRCSDEDPFCCDNAPLSNNPPRDPRCAAPQVKPRNVTTFQQSFVKGKRYLIRLVNSSAGSMFIFSIDGHNLTVIANDLVPIRPYTTKSIFIGIGQRYQVIVQATPFAPSPDSLDNYWWRTRLAQGCGSVEQDDEQTGIIRYNASAINDPNAPLPITVANDGRIACEDETNLVPIVQWDVTSLDNAQNLTELNNFTFLADISSVPFHGFDRWELTNTPLFLNYSNPSILNITGTLADPNYAAIDYDFEGSYVVLVVDGINLSPGTGKLNVPAAHPIHLHGHDFVILAQSNSTFDLNKALNEFNFVNPPRRDVALLPAGGYLAMAFKPDNPGVWLVHCHIAWHASSGLALQVFERKEQILSRIGSLNATQQTCQNWERWNLQFNQVDSGI